ncbi:hypothetical protein [Maricaulis maris]|uniref:hypothetical protein n=1 Tax=Maricaulis maris TaxID=74318 RepID=UPI003BA90962
MIALTSLTLGSTAATAQSAPVRDCSPEDIRQALAGDYAGPPCRFTEMPADASPQLAGARPTVRDERTVAQPEPRRMAVREMPRTPFPAAMPVARAEAATVRLSDDFFQGGLVGGVGRAPTIQYGYRGMIVIDASGRVALLTPGQRASGPVVSMEARAGLRTRLVGP